MKKIMLLLLFACIACFVNAQINPYSLSLKSNITKDKYNSYLLKDTFPFQRNYKTQIQLFQRGQSYIYNMPVTGKISEPVFAENNKKGFDLYRSPLDEMIIAKPDSTFHSEMPVKELQIEKNTVSKK